MSREINTLILKDLTQLPKLMQKLHTVHSIQHETGRSRSWAYHAMQQLPLTLLVDRNGQLICRCVGREEFAAYQASRRRPGNPYWG